MKFSSSVKGTTFQGLRSLMWPFWIAQNSKNFCHLRKVLLDSADLEQKLVGCINAAIRRESTEN